VANVNDPDPATSAASKASGQPSVSPVMVSLNDIAIAVHSLTSSYLKMVLTSGASIEGILKVADCDCQGRDCGCDGTFCGCDTRQNDPGSVVSFPEYLAQRQAAIAILQRELAALETPAPSGTVPTSPSSTK